MIGMLDMREVKEPKYDREFLRGPRLEMPCNKKKLKEKILLWFQPVRHYLECFIKRRILNQLGYSSKCTQEANQVEQNLGPGRTSLLGIIMTQKKGCQDIYRRKGRYGLNSVGKISRILVITLY